jgi:hypothetical protein
MKYKTFTYPVPPPEEPEELNGFLSSNRILSELVGWVDKPSIMLIGNDAGFINPAYIVLKRIMV